MGRGPSPRARDRNMRQFILSALLASVALPAMAADMPLKAPAPAPVFNTWTGFYVFGFGGYSWGRITPDDLDVAEDSKGHLHNPRPKGGVFGFGGGYNHQWGQLVGGVEVDYGFSSEKENQTFSQSVPEIVPITETINLNSKIDALASARLRLGYLVTPSFLFYGTAGVGWGRSQLTVLDIFCVNKICDTTATTGKQTHVGWVAGGGVEWQFTQHRRLRVEPLYFDFGSTTIGNLGINAMTTDVLARGALIRNF